MSECHSANIKLSDSQLPKLSSATKNVTDVTLRLSPDVIGTDKNNFPCNLLLTNRQVANLR